MVKLAGNGGIAFGSILNAKQLAVMADYIGEGDELELTTSQQLYIEVVERKVAGMTDRFKAAEKYSEHGKRREPFFKFVHYFEENNLKIELVDPHQVKC